MLKSYAVEKNGNYYHYSGGVYWDFCREPFLHPKKVLQGLLKSAASNLKDLGTNQHVISQTVPIKSSKGTPISPYVL